MINIVTNDDGIYTLGEDLITDEGLIIPKDFSWDGASVPWFATLIVPRAYKVLEASCMHDWRCSKARTPSERKVADRYLYERFKAKFNIVRSTLGYWGVRLGAFFGIGVRYKHWADPIKERIKEWKDKKT